ncbi:hypothetical protein PoB_004765700 [Plakobranchus ocellatus]|uniref:Uncharacterized protein n=1 Tax=Plakobranchus ocellatus TaxID=259542 RepID=A0AAV4BQA6_9GAST|nr:hypothetical protein PoB_004765700 [Plakobranchus ocellatus]
MSKKSDTPRVPSLKSRLLSPQTWRPWLCPECPMCRSLIIFSHCPCKKESSFAGSEWYSTWGKLYLQHHNLDHESDTRERLLTFRPRLSSGTNYARYVLSKNAAERETQNMPCENLRSPKESHSLDSCTCYVCQLYQAQKVFPSKQDLSFTVLIPCVSCRSSMLCPCRQRSCDLTLKRHTPATSLSFKRRSRYVHKTTCRSLWAYPPAKGQYLQKFLFHSQQKCIFHRFAPLHLCMSTSDIGFHTPVLNHSLISRLLLSFLALGSGHPNIMLATAQRQKDSLSSSDRKRSRPDFCSRQDMWGSQSYCSLETCSCLNWLLKVHCFTEHDIPWEQLNVNVYSDSRNYVFLHGILRALVSLRDKLVHFWLYKRKQHEPCPTPGERPFRFSSQKDASSGKVFDVRSKLRSVCLQDTNGHGCPVVQCPKQPCPMLSRISGWDRGLCYKGRFSSSTPQGAFATVAPDPTTCPMVQQVFKGTPSPGPCDRYGQRKSL